VLKNLVEVDNGKKYYEIVGEKFKTQENQLLEFKLKHQELNLEFDENKAKTYTKPKLIVDCDYKNKEHILDHCKIFKNTYLGKQFLKKIQTIEFYKKGDLRKIVAKSKTKYLKNNCEEYFNPEISLANYEVKVTKMTKNLEKLDFERILEAQKPLNNEDALLKINFPNLMIFVLADKSGNRFKASRLYFRKLFSFTFGFKNIYISAIKKLKKVQVVERCGYELGEVVEEKIEPGLFDASDY
jgi:hypothetical protein